MRRHDLIHVQVGQGVGVRRGLDRRFQCGAEHVGSVHRLSRVVAVDDRALCRRRNLDPHLEVTALVRRECPQRTHDHTGRTIRGSRTAGRQRHAVVPSGPGRRGERQLRADRRGTAAVVVVKGVGERRARSDACLVRGRPRKQAWNRAAEAIHVDPAEVASQRAARRDDPQPQLVAHLHLGSRLDVNKLPLSPLRRGPGQGAGGGDPGHAHLSSGVEVGVENGAGRHVVDLDVVVRLLGVAVRRILQHRCNREAHVDLAVGRVDIALCRHGGLGQLVGVLVLARHGGATVVDPRTPAAEQGKPERLGCPQIRVRL